MHPDAGRWTDSSTSPPAPLTPSGLNPPTFFRVPVPHFWYFFTSALDMCVCAGGWEEVPHFLVLSFLVFLSSSCPFLIFVCHHCASRLDSGPASAHTPRLRATRRRPRFLQVYTRARAVCVAFGVLLLLFLSVLCYQDMCERRGVLCMLGAHINTARSRVRLMSCLPSPFFLF